MCTDYIVVGFHEAIQTLVDFVHHEFDVVLPNRAFFIKLYEPSEQQKRMENPIRYEYECFVRKKYVLIESIINDLVTLEEDHKCPAWVDLTLYYVASDAYIVLVDIAPSNTCAQTGFHVSVVQNSLEQKTDINDFVNGLRSRFSDGSI